MADDSPGRTPDQCEFDGEVGRDLANAVLEAMPGISPCAAYNLIGNLAVAVFTTIPYVNPGDALTEFDAWARYTREVIEKEIKDRMQ